MQQFPVILSLSLTNFEVMVFCQVGPLALEIQESFFIEKFRTMLIRAHILPVRYRIIYKVCLLTYKALHGFAPDYITSLLKRYIPTRGDTHRDPVIENSPRRSNDHFLLQKPTYNYTKSSLTKRSFSYAAPDLWNQLPYTIRSCNSKDIFAGRLKTFIFIFC